MNILTIGKNGQLAQCINKVLEEKNSEHKFYFSDRNEIDITDSNSIEKYVIEHKIDIVIIS
jgi:dTDP-4-dehydrorhamnose reductase